MVDIWVQSRREAISYGESSGPFGLGSHAHNNIDYAY